MPNTAIQLAEGISWVGALNPALRLFDIFMRTERGTTYNAYLVQGRDKIALIDGVKAGFSKEWLARLESVVPLERIDYLVGNHLEPDHSGAYLAALERMPRARVVVSKNARTFLQELTNQELDPLLVGTGDALDLGGKTLKFLTAPFLHWPDTMFTYVPEDAVLFSCDFFGAHFCHEELFDDQVGDYTHAFKYYFDHIFRPFKEHVRNGLQLIEPLPLSLIAPSHGPVVRAGISDVQQQYREWASRPAPVPEGSLLVFYVSAYGLTGQLARAVAEGAQATGVRTALYDLVGTEIPTVLDDIEAADGLAVGSCTINGDAVKPIWDLLSSLATLKLRGKWAAAFGSYGWSGEAVPMIEERLKSLKFRLAGPGVRIKFTPKPEDLEAARVLGQMLGEKIKADSQGGVKA
jgi:NADH oxidase (H2O-forming)